MDAVYHSLVARNQLGYTLDDHLNDIASFVKNGFNGRYPKALLDYRDKFNTNMGSLDAGVTGIPIPVEFMAMRSGTLDLLKNAYSVTGDSGTKGGKLVDSATLLDLWQEQLYTNLYFDDLGITQLAGLMDNVKVPVMGSKIDASMYGEDDTITNSDTVLATATTSPHHIGAQFSVTNLLDIQVDTAVKLLIMSALDAIDELFLKQIINGNGNGNNISGIVDNDAVVDVDLGYNATQFNVIDNRKLIEFLTKPAKQRVTISQQSLVCDPTLMDYIMDSHVEDTNDSPMITADFNSVMGVKAIKTSVFTDTSSLFTAVAGDFSKVLTARYGVPSITIDNTTKAGSAITEVTVSEYVDMVVTQPLALVKARLTNI